MDDYYGIAARMLWPTIHRLALRVSPQDSEDLLQAGAIEVWKAANLGHSDLAYLHGAARRGIVREAIMHLSGHNVRAEAWPENEDGELLEVAAEQPQIEFRRGGLPENITRALWARLYAERAMHYDGPRAAHATDRDVAILYLVSRGYNAPAIGQEIGQPAANVRRYRTEIRRRLAAWLIEKEMSDANSGLLYRQ